MMVNDNRKRQSRGGFYGLLTLLLGLCFTRYSLQIDIPQAILLFVPILVMFLGDRDEIMAMCICCVPLYTSFQYVYALLFGIAVYAAKYSRKIRVNTAILPAVLMVLWEIVHCFGEGFVVTQFVAACLPLILLALLMCSSEKFDYDFIVRAFAFTIAATCVSLIVKLLFAAGFNLSAALSSLRRLGSNSAEASKRLLITGGQINPNTLGIICVLGLSGLLQLRTVGRGRKTDIPMIVVLLVFGAMTSSRTFLACLALMALLMMFSQKGSVGKKIRFLSAFILAAAAAVLLLKLFAPDLLEYYVSRFREADLTTGRVDLLKIYHRFIMKNRDVMFFGIGLHDFDIKVLDIYRVSDTVPHNGIQELIIAWGIPGVLLFAALCLAMIRRARQSQGAYGLIGYIPLLILLAKAQVGQMLNSPYTMLAFSFAYLSLCADLRPEDEERPEETEVQGSDLGRVLMVLWRKWWVIAAFSAVGALAVFGYTRVAVTPMYESSTLFYVNNSSAPAIRSSALSEDILASRNLVNSYLAVLTARDALTEVIERSGADLDPAVLQERITALPVDNTEVFKVVVADPDPAEAKRIANAIAEVLPERISQIIQGASVKVVEYPEASSRPSTPNNRINTMLGFIFSFVVVVIALIFRSMRDTVIRSEEDIAQVSELPVLAAVPDMIGKRRPVKWRRK